MGSKVYGGGEVMDSKEAQVKFTQYENWLIETRYSEYDIGSGKPLQRGWDDLVDRLARELKSDRVRGVALKLGISESEVDEVISAIRERFVIPASPFLMSFGNRWSRRKGYFSCYPLGYVEDSMDGIYEMVRKMRDIYMRGGGCGIDVSKLREFGSSVDNKQGVASGPVGFLYLFDAVTGTTNQGGRRRGALLVQMYWKHKDIKRFIKAKVGVPAVSSVVYSLAEDERVVVPLSNMNISVVVDDGFFEDEELVDMVAEGMWRSGDPGLLFIDNMVKYSPFNWMEDERDYPGFSNPCLVVGTWLFDGDRMVKVEDGGRSFKSWKTGDKEVVEVVCQDGRSVVVTADHKLLTTEGWVEAGKCLGKDVVIYDSWRVWSPSLVDDVSVEEREELVLMGFLFGNGFMSKKNGKFGICVKLNLSKEPDVVELLKRRGFSEWGRKKTKEYWREDDGRYVVQKVEDKVIHDEIFGMEFRRLRWFLQGLFEANGTVLERYGRVVFRTESERLAKQLQVLLGAMGVVARIKRGKSVKYKGTDYVCKLVYSVEISQVDSVKRFKDVVGFYSREKKEKLERVVRKGLKRRPPKVKNYTTKVVEIKQLGVKEVYDFTMYDGRSYNYADGVIVKNCGEYLAPANTACNLLTVNVAKISWVSNGVFEVFFENVCKFSSLACLLGNMILWLDEGYPLEEIKVKTQEVRPVGVGMTGFHTALLNLYKGDVVYGEDEEAVRFAERVQLALTLGALERSAEIAERTGVVYRWKGDYRDLHLEELREGVERGFKGYSKVEERFRFVKDVMMRRGGVYNSVVTSQPPTGSVSVFARVAGDTGIEPMYDVELVRRVRDVDGSWKEVRIVTEWLYPEIEDKEFRRKVERQLAYSVSPEGQLRMMEAFQRYVHTGISKTVNVPEVTTKQRLIELVKMAKGMRLKGFTVFRENCRVDTVYVSSKEKEGGGIIESKEELPEVRRAKLFEVSGAVKAYVTLTKDDEDRVREVFINVGKAGTTLNSMMQAFGRVMSIALRKYPELVDRFVETLEGIESGDFFRCQGYVGKSLPDLLAKILRDESSGDVKKEESSGGERVGDICPVCGRLGFKKSGGCGQCVFCGFTTC